MAGFADKVIVLRGEGMGQGDEQLGALLTASFLRLVAEAPEQPRAIFLYNGAVKLLTEESTALPFLKALEGKGVPVQACKTCIDFFELGGQLAVGQVSTMKQLVEYMQSAEIVTL